MDATEKLRAYFPSDKPFAIAHDTPTILKAVAEAFGTETVKIHFPINKRDGDYRFNMTGPADKVAESVGYEKTNFGTFIKEKTFEFMFYGTRQADRFCYLPIHADTDRYYIKEIKGNEIFLLRGPSWRTYL